MSPLTIVAALILAKTTVIVQGQPPAQPPPYEQAVPSVDGITEINRVALKDTILPRLQTEEAAFDAALAAAVTCPKTTEYAACQACVAGACETAAKAACSQDPLLEPAATLVKNYVLYYLPCKVVQAEPETDVSAQKAVVRSMESAVNPGGRRRKRSTCEDFNTDRVACEHFVDNGCTAECTDVCPLYAGVTTERQDFIDAVTDYADFDLTSLLIDYDTFDGSTGFSAKAVVTIGGASRTFALSTMVFPYQTSTLGSQIATDAMAVVDSLP